MRLKDRVGEVNTNNQGFKMKIVEYNSWEDLMVEFEDGTLVHGRYCHFKDGSIKHPKYKIKNSRNDEFYNNRIGAHSINNQGCKMKIIEYIDASHITIEFDDKFHTHKTTSWRNFVTGTVKDPNLPTVYNIGITGDVIPIMINRVKIKEYSIWVQIIKRCTTKNLEKKSRTYIDCKICDEWLYFPNFYNWITSQSNYDKWKRESGWHIDKDILYKGNKIYAPNKCCIVPHYINEMFKSSKARRGKYPIGVTMGRDGYFYAQCGNPFTGNNDHIGSYKTPEEAFYAYKKYRESLIKELAQKEFDLGNITEECYKAMFNYNIEITD